MVVSITKDKALLVVQTRRFGFPWASFLRGSVWHAVKLHVEIAHEMKVGEAVLVVDREKVLRDLIQPAEVMSFGCFVGHAVGRRTHRRFLRHLLLCDEWRGKGREQYFKALLE